MKSDTSRIMQQCLSNMDFISNRFKRTFILRFFAVVVAGALIAGAITYLMSGATVTTVFEGSRLKIISTADFILPSILLSTAIIVAFIGISATVLIAIAYYSLRTSMCHLEEGIENAGAGDLSGAYKTSGEAQEFRGMADGLRKMVSDFSRIVSDLKTDTENLQGDLESMERTGQKIPEGMKEDLEKLRAELFKFNL